MWRLLDGQPRGPARVGGQARAEVVEEESDHCCSCTRTPSWRELTRVSLQMPTLRTTLLSLLAIVVILLLGFLFHPSSPYSKPLESYYSGAPLAPGTYNSDGILAPNPLPEGGAVSPSA